ncbi:hypothetical protein LCGC14_0416590 [marine sediment metagenome]|uniref:Uncharacterized protein n=1 Tax=marine sediment metagenome TaxID=412755 RepID=A0A0F9SS65_9ZZZZ
MTWEIRNTSGVIIDWDKYHVVTHDEGGVDPLTTVVFKSLFDAQTVLHATSDDTPVALTVTEQTLVGRLTGENISAVAIGIANDNILQVDHASPADDDYAKFTAAGLEGRSYQELVNDISGVIKATDVEVSELSTATYDDVQDYINFQGDRTLFTGGGFTDNGDGTVAVAAGTGWCKETDSDTAVGRFFDFSADNSVSLTDQVTNYLYVDYNAGTPQIVVATSRLTFGFQQDHIPIGCIFRDGTALHPHPFARLGIQGINRAHMHHIEEADGHRASGIVTTGTGTRNLDVTAGVLYVGLDRTTTSPFTTPNSGTADATEANKLHDADGGFASTDVGKQVHNTTDDTYANVTAFVNSGELTLDGDIFVSGENYDLDIFSYWYTSDGGSTWTDVPGATAISNTQYNNIASGLASLTSNKYGVHWVYMDFDGGHLHIVYGQGNYTANQAETAAVPSILPNLVTNYCVLLAKIINQEGTNTLTITYPWTSTFTSSLATDHGSLAGLSDADHTQYPLKTLWDANTILKADIDNTPEALTVAEQRIVGRITSGEITGLTAAEVATLVEGSVDHGSVAGLGDDDHTQYFLLAGEATDAKLYSGADFYLYSDAGSTVKAHIDGATGHIGLGGSLASAAYAIYTNEIINIDDDEDRYGMWMEQSAYKTSAAYIAQHIGGVFVAQLSNSNTQNWTNQLGLVGIFAQAQILSGTAAVKTITGIAGVYVAKGLPSAANDPVVTNSYGVYIGAQALVPNSKLTNDYGIYIGNQAGGATLNYAIYTAGGSVYHVGDLTAANIITAGNVDGIDVSAHDVATTGVHGAGGNTILYSNHTGDVDAHVVGATAGQLLVATAATTAVWQNTGVTLTSPTINGTIATTGLTMPAITLGGAVAGGDQAFTGVGDMTFTAGSILKSGGSNGNTLLLAANDTTFITLTTGTTDACTLNTVTMQGTWKKTGTVAFPEIIIGSWVIGTDITARDTRTFSCLQADGPYYIDFTARLDGTGAVEVARMQSVAAAGDAFWSMGAAQQNLFYTSGLVTLGGAVTLGSTIALGGKLTGGANEIEGSNFDINGGDITGTTWQTYTFTLTGNLIRSGAHALTLTTLGTTDVTFPTSGTLATQTYADNAVSTHTTDPNAHHTPPVSYLGLIEDKVLVGDTSTVTFSNIPAGYAFLQLQGYDIYGNSTSWINLLMRFNSDTGNNYDASWGESGVNSTSTNALTGIRIARFSDTDAYQAHSTNQINIFNRPTHEKVAFGTTNTYYKGGGSVEDIVSYRLEGKWRNVADEIDTITLVTSTGQIVAGTRFILLGVKI